MVAMESLTEYAYRARLREITDMNVLIEASASPKTVHPIRISSDSLATVHRMDVNIWFHSLQAIHV